MAVMQKTYDLAPAMLWNAIADIVEIRKGKTTRYDDESMSLTTEMYGIKTEYLFRVVRIPTETTVIIETDGESKNDIRRVKLMFDTLDNMAAPFSES